MRFYISLMLVSNKCITYLLSFLFYLAAGGCALFLMLLGVRATGAAAARQAEGAVRELRGLGRATYSFMDRAVQQVFL